MIKNTWNNKALENYKKLIFPELSTDIVERIYTSHLIGNDKDLVMHGGGNISVKTSEKNTLGENIETLRIKGSGWDLESINATGLPALEMNKLLKLENITKLTDEDLVSFQRQCLLDPSSPNPSIETLLHAFIPKKFVEHTHSTPFLFLANIKNSKEIIDELFDGKVVFLPYVKPGFDLAMQANEAYKSNIGLEGMFLEHHGHFTWGDTAKESYSRLIKQTNKVEKWITKNMPKRIIKSSKVHKSNPQAFNFISKLRASINHLGGNSYIFTLDQSPDLLKILEEKDIEKFIKRWVLTPDHIIRTKGKPLFFDLTKKHLTTKQIESKVIKFKQQYISYFNNYSEKNLHSMLDPLPNMIWVRGFGVIAVSKDRKSGKIINDLASQTLRVFKNHIDTKRSFHSLSETDLFEMEYWSLEQAKLGKKIIAPLYGKVVVITGGAGTIGIACAKKVLKNGGNVVLVDNSQKGLDNAQNILNSDSVSSLKIDITESNAAKNILNFCLLSFGGADILISNAGSAVQGMTDELGSKEFRDSFELNFFAHYELSKCFLHFFKKSKNNGQILFNISKQSVNPGINFGAYGIPKLSIIGLMKQLALENGKYGIRVNGINADKIKSGLLTSQLIKERSRARNISQEGYMRGNLLGAEVSADDVAEGFMSLILSLEKTTGHIITIDGGNIEASLR
jgi:rhamnose utilization protein RhaD (predicted bifunctional aldolase and dehydrogenase)/NAD(P)-dependent dehydrogenase (short-subunit alcohol dehydrogenase family)